MPVYFTTLQEFRPVQEVGAAEMPPISGFLACYQGI
jgi:hypothetical protein